MERNIEKWVEEGKKTISERRRMSIDDLFQLMRMAENGEQNDLYNAILNAYYFGFAVGYRQRKEESR